MEGTGEPFFFFLKLLVGDPLEFKPVSAFLEYVITGWKSLVINFGEPFRLFFFCYVIGGDTLYSSKRESLCSIGVDCIPLLALTHPVALALNTTMLCKSKFSIFLFFEGLSSVRFSTFSSHCHVVWQHGTQRRRSTYDVPRFGVIISFHVGLKSQEAQTSWVIL